MQVLYSEGQTKLLRASTRSIIYIFLTKMVFGLALELPFDFFIEAPLKAFLEVVEEWIHFVRLKKEEIFTQG
ncbi:hypothetical protein A2112_02090 [Candidatus Woesebacteria bacterium GWA1_42_12]|uniref:Uncharacterized protein n=1 Tax=Candidatus Woesebacteria bacterium GWA1_42_12 TaxID=1802472 RepID=A0A1F7WMT9_9BACT|nr:MAG: hypothetical protein A2112_02090 [Candidatus Woesebacteria bacterium GWA1_42_12]